MATKRRGRSNGGKSRHGSHARRTTPPHRNESVGGDPKRAARAAAIQSDLQRVIGPSAIEFLPVKRFRPNLHNARRHSDRQIEQIAASIRQFGFLNPIIIDETDRVLAGHGRIEAARQLNLKKIPCVRVDHLTPEAKRA